ncbi:MAG: hypothetical protein ACK5DG_11045 [Chitinophagaceae bacterium]|jgi:hypothetical protein
MKSDKLKYLLDFIPLFILSSNAIKVSWKVATTNIVFSNEHYTGLTLLIITFILLLIKHRIGVLSLGFVIILGVFKIVSYSAPMEYLSFGGSVNGYGLPVIKIQAIFILWLLIHLLVSLRHYKGIFQKTYWQDLLKSHKGIK